MVLTSKRSDGKTLILSMTLLLMLTWGTGCQSGETKPLRVAVSSNFVTTFRELAAAYGDTSGVEIVDSSGSTGLLMAQIRNGAPFDVFLAADDRRPAFLESEGRIVPGSRFTYAEGLLVLWTPRPHLTPDAVLELLTRSDSRISLANPKQAPYGRAALEYLDLSGLSETVTDRLVYGTNANQAHQFVATENAGVGFVAKSQITDGKGSSWIVPLNKYRPIRQQAVQLSADVRGSAFLTFLRSPEAQAVIKKHGYTVMSHGAD